jgi:hypothetical protein
MKSTQVFTLSPIPSPLLRLSAKKKLNVSIMILIFFLADHDINLYKDKITWKGNFAYI